MVWTITSSIPYLKRKEDCYSSRLSEPFCDQRDEPCYFCNGWQVPRLFVWKKLSCVNWQLPHKFYHSKDKCNCSSMACHPFRRQFYHSLLDAKVLMLTYCHGLYSLWGLAANLSFCFPSPWFVCDFLWLCNSLSPWFKMCIKISISVKHSRTDCFGRWVSLNWALHGACWNINSNGTIHQLLLRFSKDMGPLSFLSNIQSKAASYCKLFHGIDIVSFHGLEGPTVSLWGVGASWSLARGLMVIWRLSCSKWLWGGSEMSIPGAWLSLTTPPLSPAEMLTTSSGAVKWSHGRWPYFMQMGRLNMPAMCSTTGHLSLFLP